jgi:hypothetical protein
MHSQWPEIGEIINNVLKLRLELKLVRKSLHKNGGNIKKIKFILSGVQSSSIWILTILIW